MRQKQPHVCQLAMLAGDRMVRTCPAMMLLRLPIWWLSMTCSQPWKWKRLAIPCQVSPGVGGASLPPKSPQESESAVPPATIGTRPLVGDLHFTPGLPPVAGQGKPPQLVKALVPDRARPESHWLPDGFWVPRQPCQPKRAYSRSSSNRQVARPMTRSAPP